MENGMRIVLNFGVCPQFGGAAVTGDSAYIGKNDSE